MTTYIGSGLEAVTAVMTVGTAVTGSSYGNKGHGRPINEYDRTWRGHSLASKHHFCSLTLRQRVHLKLLRSNLAKRGAGLMMGSSAASGSSSSWSAGVDFVPGVLGGT